MFKTTIHQCDRLEGPHTPAAGGVPAECARSQRLHDDRTSGLAFAEEEVLQGEEVEQRGFQFADEVEFAVSVVAEGESGVAVAVAVVHGTLENMNCRCYRQEDYFLDHSAGRTRHLREAHFRTRYSRK